MRAHAHARGREVIHQPSAADAGGADGPGDEGGRAHRERRGAHDLSIEPARLNAGVRRGALTVLGR